METRWRAASGEQPSARGDAVVVEVVDEAQPQRVLGGGRERGDQRLEGAVVVLGLDGAAAGGSSVGSSRRRRRWRSSAVVVVTRYSHARRWSAWRSRG